MTKQMTLMVVALLTALVVLSGLWVYRDLLIGSSTEIQCDDGVRRTIDLREFSTQYWTYSVELEASIKDIANLSGKLDPQKLQELNAAQQQANEYRKYLVVGFNSCAISKSQFLEYETRFQALDSIARQIDGLLKQPSLDSVDRNILQQLVEQYSSISRTLTESDTG